MRRSRGAVMVMAKDMEVGHIAHGLGKARPREGCTRLVYLLTTDSQHVADLTIKLLYTDE